MAVDRRITGEPTELETESVTIETPEDQLTVENIEMTEDGGALVNPMDEQEEVEFDWDRLEEIGLGMMELSDAELYDLTPRSFNNKLVGFNKKNEQLSQNHLESCFYSTFQALQCIFATIPHPRKSNLRGQPGRNAWLAGTLPGD